MHIQLKEKLEELLNNALETNISDYEQYCVKYSNTQQLNFLQHKYKVLSINYLNKGYRSKVFVVNCLYVFKKSDKPNTAIHRSVENTTILHKRQNTRKFILVLYKNEPQILKKIKVANLLGSFIHNNSQLPIRYPVCNTILRIHFCNSRNKSIYKQKKNNNKTSNRLFYGCLHNYLPGNTICWEAYTTKHIKTLGEELGKLHECTRRAVHVNSKLRKKERCSAKEDKSTNKVLNTHQNKKEYYSTASIADLGQLPLETYVMHTNLQNMQLYFSQTGVQSALYTKLHIPPEEIKVFQVLTKNMQLFLRQVPQYPSQPLHMDFVRGNILFRGSQITGILDLEKASCGTPLLDISRTLAFLLVDCKYKPKQKIKKYFLYSGYMKKNGIKINKEEIRVINKLTKIYLFYDFYKFLKHTPYEALDNNEHFLRTMALLGIRVSNCR